MDVAQWVHRNQWRLLRIHPHLQLLLLHNAGPTLSPKKIAPYALIVESRATPLTDARKSMGTHLGTSLSPKTHMQHNPTATPFNPSTPKLAFLRRLQIDPCSHWPSFNCDDYGASSTHWLTLGQPSIAANCLPYLSTPATKHHSTTCQRPQRLQCLHQSFLFISLSYYG